MYFSLNLYLFCICFASLEVLVTLTTDVGKVLSTLHSVKPKGAINIITGIKIAHVSCTIMQ